MTKSLATLSVRSLPRAMSTRLAVQNFSMRPLCQLPSCGRTRPSADNQTCTKLNRTVILYCFLLYILNTKSCHILSLTRGCRSTAQPTPLTISAKPQGDWKRRDSIDLCTGRATQFSDTNGAWLGKIWGEELSKVAIGVSLSSRSTPTVDELGTRGTALIYI